MLVVEDDPAIAHLLEEYLSREGFDVNTARDGERGGRSPETPDRT